MVPSEFDCVSLCEMNVGQRFTVHAGCDVRCSGKHLPCGFLIFTVVLMSGPMIDTSSSCIVESTGISTGSVLLRTFIFNIVACTYNKKIHAR